MKFQAPRGTNDILPSQTPLWRWLQEQFFQVSDGFGYKEIRTPTFEDTNLFVRSAGETSDIVSKEMYTFLDRSDRSLTLKPEGTAGVMRAAVQASLFHPGQTSRLSYFTKIYRYERPQQGRYREAHQFGLEFVGEPGFLADVEIIEATYRFYTSVGLEGLSVSLNSLGKDKCRNQYRQALLTFMEPNFGEMSPEAVEKFRKNPLRLLDSKDPAILQKLAGAPKLSDFWEPESIQRFNAIGEALTSLGIPFRKVDEMVRGLDYYTETVFEVHSDAIGSQSALCGGGRFDHLIQEIGGPDLPSVGVGIGVERVILALTEKEIKNPAFVAIAPFPNSSSFEPQNGIALLLAAELRAAAISAQLITGKESIRSIAREADRIKSRFLVVIGEEEATSNQVTIKDMIDGNQVSVPLKSVVAKIKSLLVP